jgi:predicted FMN-binding regulatory protein PaiB
MRREPRICLSVDDDAPPYGFVRVDGEAEIIDDQDLLREVATRLATHYLGADHAEAFAKRNAVPGVVVVRLRPTHMVGEFDLTA